MKNINYLNSSPIDHFFIKGHMIIHNCFSEDTDRQWTLPAFARKEAIDRDWIPLSAKAPGWHKDGGFFRNFLDSPKQGLLKLIIWSDIEHKSGGAFIACDSVVPVARYLVAHPEGVIPTEYPIRSLIDQCGDFMEFTGNTGNNVLLHPYILHAVSQNHSEKPRFLTNPPVFLREPVRFNRSNPGDHSPVELLALNGLGVDSMDFHPTASGERMIHEREKSQT